MVGVEAAVVIACPIAIALPHLLPLHRVTPLLAAGVWLFALCLRALVAVGAALFVFLYLPRTGIYEAVAHWCVDEVLPLLATHLGLSGHPLVHAAIVLPGLALAASLLWVAFGLARGWLALRRKLREALGEGPLGSTVIRDSRIVVGVTGIGRGRIVVSDVALGAMDPDELAASLNHERGHIARRHRPTLLAGSVLSALGRMLPGTRAAEAELRFSLERDADDYAVRRTADPLALASAICKAASGGPLAGATGLGGSSRVGTRLDYLEGQGRAAGAGLERLARGVALALVALCVGLAVALPSWALAVPRAEHTLSATESHCRAAR